MDFEKNPLMNDTSRCRREVKRWLALVIFTLATFVITIGINAMWPSPELQQAASLLAAASVMAIICSLSGIKQSNDHCRSVQYGLSVFEAMKKDLAKMDLEWSRGLHADGKAQITDLKRQIADLEKARSECNELRGRNDDLCKKLNEAMKKADWFQRKHADGKALLADAKRQIADLESANKTLNGVIDRLLKIHGDE